MPCFFFDPSSQLLSQANLAVLMSSVCSLFSLQTWVSEPSLRLKLHEGKLTYFQTAQPKPSADFFLGLIRS